MNKKILVLTIVIALGLILAPMSKIQAQTQTPTPIKLHNTTDTAKDLEVESPGLLPTSPFYFFKNAFQGVRSALTFNPVKKAQLKMKYANQKILEAKELAKEKKNSKFVSKSIERYQRNVEDISRITKRAKKKIQEQDKGFVKNALDQTLKQNRLLDNIEKKISKEVKERIRKSREKANQNNAQILSNTANKRTLGKQIRETIESQKGGDFKEFKDIAILKKIQNHSSEEIKDIIKESNNYTLSNFKEKLKNMPTEEKKKFDDYIDSTGGDDVTHFQLLQKLEKGSSKDIKEQVEKARERVMKKIENRIQNLETESPKENVLESLQNGDMDNLSTIQELEESIAPGLVEKVINAKHQALNNFKKKMENAKSEEKRKKILEQAKENANINKLQVLNEIEGNVSEEDKDFVKQMIEKVNKEIEDKINSAPVRDKDEMLKEIAGSSPKAMETAQRMISDPRLKREMLQAQIENLKRKIESSKDPEKIENLKEKLEQNNKIRQIVQQKAPEIDRELEQKRKQYMNQINQEKANQQLERANKQLSDLKEHFQKLENEYPEFKAALKQGPALNLMEEAQNKLQSAQKAIEQEKYGEAFGVSTATMNTTNNAYRAVKKFEAQTIMEQEHAKKRAKNIEQQGQKILQDLIESGILNKKEIQDIKEKFEQGEIEEIIQEYKDKIPAKDLPSSPSSGPPSSQEERGQAPGQNQGQDKPSQDLEEFNIESYLKQSGLSQERINQIKENLENVPDDIKQRIKQVPTEILLKVSKNLQKGIKQPPQIDKNIEREQDVEQEREKEQRQEYEIDENVKQTQEQKQIKKDTPNKPVSSDSNTESHCQNFPPPSFCPGGVEGIIVVGKDKNGCPIYDCKPSQDQEGRTNKDIRKKPDKASPQKSIPEKDFKQGQNAGSTGSIFEKFIKLFK